MMLVGGSWGVPPWSKFFFAATAASRTGMTVSCDFKDTEVLQDRLKAGNGSQN